MCSWTAVVSFLSFSLPVSPRTCCSCGCPQGWEHGQVISRADQPWHLSSAAYGDWGFNSQAGSDPLSGNFQSHDLIWSIYWEYTGLCCWVSFMHLGNLGVIPRNGQCVCVLFCWRKISSSGPGARALGQGKRLRWCVSCCPQSLQLPTESLPCSATIPGQSTPLSLFFTNHEWSPTLVAEHLILARGLQTTCMYMDHVRIHSEDLLMQSNSCCTG